MSTPVTEDEVQQAREWLAQSRGFRSIPVGTKETNALIRGCRELVKLNQAEAMWKHPGSYVVFRLRSAGRLAMYRTVLGQDYNPHSGPSAIYRESQFLAWTQAGNDPREFAAAINGGQSLPSMAEVLEAQVGQKA